jgi:hypothetical protein
MRRHERRAECGGRGVCLMTCGTRADGEVVWSWRAHAGAKSARSSKGFARVTVANAGSPRRAPISRKTTAQGKPVVTSCTCGFRARANYLCAGAPGACGHPAFPAPSLSRGQRRCKARATCAARRGTCALAPSVGGAKATKHPDRFRGRSLDCFAPLAMTADRPLPCAPAPGWREPPHDDSGRNCLAIPRQPESLPSCV